MKRFVTTFITMFCIKNVFYQKMMIECTPPTLTCSFTALKNTKPRLARSSEASLYGINSSKQKLPWLPIKLTYTFKRQRGHFDIVPEDNKSRGKAASYLSTEGALVQFFLLMQALLQLLSDMPCFKRVLPSVNVSKLK